MNINLEDDNIKQMVAKTIFDSLTVEKHDELLQSAIKSLFQKDQYSGYNSKTVIQGLFERAATSVASEILFKQLKEDTEFKAYIEGLLRDIVAKLMKSETREHITTTIANGVARALAEKW